MTKDEHMANLTIMYSQHAYKYNFLASTCSGYITGTEIYVTGGFELGNGIRIPRYNWTDHMKFRV